jgi:hypothetical protein
MTVETYVVVLAAVGPAALVLGAVIWTHIQHQAAIDRLDDRLAHLVAGVSLLTDTTEGALRDIATEIGRLAAVTDGSRPRTTTVSQRRVSTASKRGHTVQDIAAMEEMSEGEVRLHLQLAKARKERVNHASLR